MSVPLLELDGTDVTGVAVEASLTRRLNRPAQATIKIPMDAAIAGPGSKLKATIDGNLFFHGLVMDCETDSGEDDGYTVYNASDPMELWAWRPARDYDSITPGNFIDPYFVKPVADGGKGTGPQMVESMLLASENPAEIPTAAEGPLFISYGSFAAGGVDLSGIPVTWPMTIAEVVALLTSTGEVDVVLTPVDPGGGIMAQVDAYNGNYGTNLSGSVVFQYGMGAYNVRRLRWHEDMSNVTNKLQYFFGPKETTRRYKANITGDDPCLPGNIGNPGPFGSPPKNGVGGSLPGNPNELAPNPLGVRRAASQAAYGVRMEIQEFDVDVIYEKEGCVPNAATLGCCTDLDPTRILYRRLWQLESWIRAVPRTLVHIEPTRETAIGDFDIGDLVMVEADTSIRGGFSGVQRIYEYTISWSAEESVLALSELQTSADQEGA